MLADTTQSFSSTCPLTTCHNPQSTIHNPQSPNYFQQHNYSPFYIVATQGFAMPLYFIVAMIKSSVNFFTFFPPRNSSRPKKLAFTIQKPGQLADVLTRRRWIKCTMRHLCRPRGFQAQSISLRMAPEAKYRTWYSIPFPRQTAEKSQMASSRDRQQMVPKKKSQTQKKKKKNAKTSFFFVFDGAVA